MATTQPLQDFVSNKMSQAAGLGTLALLALYCIAKIIYRLYFHPLAKFPGPRIAAATHLYEVYWDYFRKGQYIFQIERMHQKYGMACHNTTAPENRIHH